MCLQYQICTGSSTKMAEVEPLLQYRTLSQPQQEVRILSVSSVISAKTGISYPDLEPVNEFWNLVPSSFYRSLMETTEVTVVTLQS